MGLFDFFKRTTTCPFCGNPGARKGGSGRVLCPNPSCPNFDAALGRQGTSRQAGARVPTSGDFSPSRPLDIRYRNAQGIERTFVGDAATARRVKDHIVVQVKPTGHRLSLSRQRILNLGEVEAALPPRVEAGQDWPSMRERQVLNYHKKYKTSSPLYEKIRAKYPNW